MSSVTASAISKQPHTRSSRQRALERRIAFLDQRLARLKRIGDRVSWVRLGVFVIGFVLGLNACAAGNVWYWLTGLAALIGFFAAVHVHRQLRQSLALHRLWRDLTETYLARMRLEWDALPPPLSAVSDPLAVDLDLTGPRSLHRLLDTARTIEGSERLRSWFLNAEPELGTTDRRQKLVKELLALPLLRDKLALRAALTAGIGLRQRWRISPLQEWFTRAGKSDELLPVLRVLALLAVVNVTLFLASAVFGMAPLWLLTGLGYMGLLMYQMQRHGEGFLGALQMQETLEALESVFVLLETHYYAPNSALKTLCAPFLDARRPSLELRKMGRIVTALGVTQNPMFGLLLNALVPWDLYFTYRLSRCREELAALFPVWADVWFEVEALSALAVFADLNPDYTFPAVSNDTQPVLHGVQIGHPLIDPQTRVCNDFTLNQVGQIVIITGSNMAGKSTFLRTLGVNLCLAYAGGPVCAAEFSAAAFRLYTCIRVSDSLADGFSYFYAEVQRLKGLLDALKRDHPLPLFFLIDEIFRGTNNQERLIGSRSFLRAVVGQHGLGLIATHDLELIRLAEESALISNYHFREDVQDKQMIFDYRLRSGPCPTTNALKIMQLAGLPVESEQVH